MVLSSAAVDVLALIHYEPMDQMLAAVCGGAMIGLALGIIFAQGATTGGTDLIARLVKLKLPWASMGKLLLVVDMAVILLVAVAFGNITTALYGIIAQVVSAYVTDAVLYGLDTAKVAYIISNFDREISEAIVQRMDRGVTILKGEGAYSGDKKRVLMCAFKQKQIVALKRAVKETDRATYQAMEALIHNLNTMHSRAGAQTPFSSINYGTDTSPEGRMAMRNVLSLIHI